MSDKKAFSSIHASLTELEGAALSEEENHAKHGRQLDLLIGQGKGTTKTLGDLVAAIGDLTERLNAYLDENASSGGLGARVTRLEGRVDRMASDGGE